MNIIIPMAGPSDTITINDIKMLKNLFILNKEPFIKFFLKKINIVGNVVFVTQQEYENTYNVTDTLKTFIPNPNVFKLNKFEQGAALTILNLKNSIDLDSPIIISNSDYLIDWDSEDFLKFIKETKCDACLVTYESSLPKHSYCKINENGEVSEVTEKKVISSHANVGLYYWSSARIMFESIEKMVNKNITYNNLYYISLSFNELINSNKKVLNYPISNITIFDCENDIQNITNKLY